jgi:hypothetical protein
VLPHVQQACRFSAVGGELNANTGVEGLVRELKGVLEVSNGKRVVGACGWVLGSIGEGAVDVASASSEVGLRVVVGGGNGGAGAAGAGVGTIELAERPVVAEGVAHSEVGGGGSALKGEECALCGRSEARELHKKLVCLLPALGCTGQCS